MCNEQLSLIASVLSATLRMSVPLGFAAIGGAISERSGIIALGLEGYMTIGAFFAVLGAYMTNSAAFGLLAGALAAGIFALIYGFVSIHLKAQQTVSGLGMNTIAPGLVAILMVAIFGNKGKSALTPNLQPIELPVISKIPFLGEVFSGHTILLYAFLLIAVLCWVIMYKTPEGIRLRSAGTNPEVIEALGLSVKAIQYRAVFTSGILAGIGGAYLSIAQLNFYSSDMVSGRGFIAIAVFVFAGWNPVRCIWASLLLGFTEAIQMRLQTLGMPSQIIQMLPYFCTLLVLANIRTSRKKHHIM